LIPQCGQYPRATEDLNAAAEVLFLLKVQCKNTFDSATSIANEVGSIDLKVNVKQSHSILML
jgi:hypothetical protein